MTINAIGLFVMPAGKVDGYDQNRSVRSVFDEK